MFKRWFWPGVAVLALLAAGAAWMHRGDIAFRAFQRGVPQAMANVTMDNLGPGLHVGFCGTGSPMPDRRRAGPCTAVVAEGRLFVFDNGDGAAETLNVMGLPPARISAVFLTHFHSDHIDGLGGLALQRWAAGGAAAPLPLHGPPGVEQVAAGFNTAYGLDQGYRVAHHGDAVVPPSGFGLQALPFPVPPEGGAIVYDQDGVRITAFSVDHAPIAPAVGYRIEAGGRSVVISGDTKRSAGLVSGAKAADLLVHEALSPKLLRVLGGAADAAGNPRVAKIFADIEDYHTTPREIAAVAKEAGVGAVALTHITPPMPLPFLDIAFLEGADRDFQGPFWMMRDGDVISLAPDGAISRRSLIRR